jgi:S1-C subfamily serine protease
LKKYYVRAQLKDNDIRGMTILYDQAMEGIMEPVVVAMSSAFAPFESPVDGVSGQRRVEYSTGVIVSALGHVIADRDATNGCNVISVAGMGNAERIGDDVASGLALLQLYGAKAQPIALAAEAPKSSELTLVGIADPQLQGGNKNVSVAAARLGGVSGSTVLLDPAPSQGFSGAAALDAQGQLVGMVEIKPQPAGTPAQAALVPSATIKSFLDNAKITALVGRTSVESAKAAVARVICVRK